MREEISGKYDKLSEFVNNAKNEKEQLKKDK